MPRTGAANLNTLEEKTVLIDCMWLQNRLWEALSLMGCLSVLETVWIMWMSPCSFLPPRLCCTQHRCFSYCCSMVIFQAASFPDVSPISLDRPVLLTKSRSHCCSGFWSSDYRKNKQHSIDVVFWGALEIAFTIRVLFALWNTIGTCFLWISPPKSFYSHPRVYFWGKDELIWLSLSVHFL